MHLSLDKLNSSFSRILVDGNRFHQYKSIKHHTIVKGDGKYLSIAAASILAKTYRDEYMIDLDEEFPCYLWKNNKGYPTKFHRNMIVENGVSKYHRRTFCRKIFNKLY